MENRFLDYGSDVIEARPRTKRVSLGKSMTTTYSRAASAAQRALVVLIENGGVDLGIPKVVEEILKVVPQSDLLPQGARQKLVAALRDEIQRITDNLLESAELAINRYSGAAPDLFDTVSVLRNGTASYDDLRNKLFALSKEGKVIDLLILTHGSDDSIAVHGGITGARIRQMRADFGKPLSIRSVYMMNCVGSSLNQAWIDAGAKVSSGAIRNNYLPEPTTFFFWSNWKEGQNFESAVTSAYRKTVNVMNAAVRALVTELLPPPLGGAAASLVDFEKMDFVKDSAPVIQGQRTLTISSDDLSFSQTVASGMCTTVLPLSVVRSLGLATAASTRTRVQNSLSSRYESPSTTMSTRRDYARMMNPAAAAPVIAGIAVTEALQVGLGAAAIVQSQVNASGGSFQLFYDKAQRLLTADARARMPGAKTPRSKYRLVLMQLAAGNPIADFANANVVIEWEGNPYGEIATPVIQRDLKSSSEWSRSSANIAISHIERIPLPGTDPRAWPLVFSYTGTYDPAMNGHFEFSGEFEVNAFGGLKFNKHEVVSRSLLDFAIQGKPEDYVIRSQDTVVPVPTIPPEQVEYLKGVLP